MTQPIRWARALRSLSWLIDRPIAHRGLHDAANGIIENTSSAFEAAIRHGYAIECDLQLSGDGEAMVFHDATLDRLTEQRGKLLDRTAAELQSVRFKATADRMPTLAELIEQVDGRATLLIELKSHWDGSLALARRAAEVTEGYHGPFALMSFDPELVAAIRELAPQAVRGIVAERMTDPTETRLDVARRIELRYLKHIAKSWPYFLSYDVQGLPSGLTRAFRAAGLPVICWTVRDPETAKRARRYCDQITFEGFLP
jgi:glycerophosphoryl diester phosphodiesterase